MEYAFKNFYLTNMLQRVFAVFMVLLVTSCGGGGGSPGATGGSGSGSSGGGGTTTTEGGTISLTLTDTVGNSTNSLSPGSPLIAKATVKDSKGKLVANQLVKFDLGSTLANLSPASGTALTNTQGVAQISLEAGSEAGAAEISAKSTIESDEVTSNKVAFSIGAAPTATPAAMNFIKASPADKSIVIKGAGGNGRTEVALLTFAVVDSSNAGVANKKVNFALQTSAPVTLVNQSGVTGQNGEVTATVNSGSIPTSVRVIATVDGSTISALSDTITVTTGQPTQEAFSVSVETYNISGWNHDDEQTKVNVLMADQFGNPVADGTPVVFQTDSGAIGSSENGGCVTTGGKCFVSFRSQDPRFGIGNAQGKTPGIATITVSSTSGSSTLTGTAYVSLSGDTPHVFVGGVELVGGENFTTTSCTAYSLSILIQDLHGNPLPKDTKVEIADAKDVTASTVYPDKVPNTLQPSTHLIPITPDETKCAVGGGHTGTFSLKVTPPLGAVNVYFLSLTFP